MALFLWHEEALRHQTRCHECKCGFGGDQGGREVAQRSEVALNKTQRGVQSQTHLTPFHTGHSPRQHAPFPLVHSLRKDLCHSCLTMGFIETAWCALCASACYTWVKTVIKTKRGPLSLTFGTGGTALLHSGLRGHEGEGPLTRFKNLQKNGMIKVFWLGVTLLVFPWGSPDQNRT